MSVTDLMGPPGLEASALVRPARPSAADLKVRIVDAALDEIAEVGVSRMTMEAVAARAGISRATVYRSFPGGRDAIVAAVVDLEASRCFTTIAAEIAVARDLRSVLVAAVAQGTAAVTQHPALAKVLELEPELVATQLEFTAMDTLLAQAASAATPFLAPWLAPEEAARAAELVVRIVVSYLFESSDELDLATEAGAGSIVDRFLLPGLEAMGAASSKPSHPNQDLAKQDLANQDQAMSPAMGREEPQ